jgi:enoyl-[acyl-carrier protein] reductase III
LNSKGWALILGASSGFGAETARELARAGYDICGVHLDRRPTLPQAEAVAANVRAMGRRALFFNVNAADTEKRREVLDALAEQVSPDGSPARVLVLVHSLAFGTTRPYIGGGPAEAVSPAQMSMTLDVMANSLVYWTQDLVWRGLLGEGGRVFAMTSAGSTHVILNYGPVSAAKAALESHVRQLAYELAPLGIAANAVRAGVTETAALRKIPGSDQIVERGLAKNPSGRITTVSDVARAITAFCDERLAWMTGNVIGVDGGEELLA